MDLAYYNQKQAEDGPAMTFAIAAIAENLVAASGCSAFTYELQSRFPNYRALFFQMSKQANNDINANGGVNPAFPFLKGHGGFLQIVPFGYLGLDYHQENLTIQPSLPLPFKHLQPPEFQYKGASIKAQMNSTHTKITMISSPLGMSNWTLPMTLNHPNSQPHSQYWLRLNQTITVPNDMYWKNPITHKNLLQCRPVSSKATTLPGHWAGAATDGNVGTRWEPISRNTSQLIVDMTDVTSQPIERIHID